MMKLVLGLITAVAGAAVLASIATAAPSPWPPPTILDGQKYCAVGPYVVNVTQNITDDVDRGADGHVWAVVNYQRILQVTQTAPGVYCAGTRYTGTFTTVGGRSPQGTTYLPPGITGTIGGGFKTTTFRARFVPKAPTTGTTAYDYTCDPLTGSCLTYTDWVGQYFQSVSGYGWDKWQFLYQIPGFAPYWSNTSVGNVGDVTTPPAAAQG